MPNAPKATVRSADVAEDDHIRFSRFIGSMIHTVGGGGSLPTPPKPVTAADLPPEAQAILGLRCQLGDCDHEQPLCPPDPRITCQLIPADPSLKSWVRDWVLIPWNIANAKKGDLIMSPGGSNGIIGSLLSQLRPPQHYTHMGIMTKDFVEVRHATVSDDWLEDHPNGSIPLDGPEPTDGFQPNALRYGWPGTITQTIDAAYQSSLDDKFAGASVKSPDGKDYVIHALSFEPAVVNTEPDDSKPPNWVTLQCLVVSPCPPSVEARNAVERIADEVRTIRGHYRYYAYSDASIALNPKYFGPPQLEAMEPDASNPCGPLIPVKRTIPVVCSTLIWAAVQRMNARGDKPELLLNSGEQEHADCDNEFERKPHDDQPGGIFDGLFDYDEKQRQNAAGKFYEYLHKKVQDEVAKKVPGIVKDLGGVAIALSAVMALLNQPVAVICSVLGISLADAATLVDWITDMPDDVANQVVNAFVFDWCETDAKDSDRWKNPGAGRSVSPDNIIRSWMSTLVHSPERIIGIYGRNQTANVRPPQWTIVPLQAWAVSAGPSGMQGLVMFEGQPINGAEVKVCCTRAVTASHKMFGLKRESFEDGVYQMTPPAGNYMAVATWTDPASKATMKDEKIVTLEFLKVLRVDFDLKPPPDSNREVIVTGKMDIVSRVAFGHDWWGHPHFEMPHLRLGPYGRPGTADADMGRHGHTMTSQGLSDYGSVAVNVDVDWQPDNSVKVSWITAIFDGKDQKVSAHEEDVLIAADSTKSWVVDLGTAGPWPDRAHIEFSIENARQK